MIDVSRLVALLQLDERGDYLVQSLIRVLVDSGKRQQLIIKLLEINEGTDNLQEDTILTRSEAEVLRIIQDARKPMSASEVQEIAESDSLSRYRQHSSAVLNDLTAKGLLGKVSGPGRIVYFAPPREAVRLALTQLGHTPEDCDFGLVREMTELPCAVVVETVEDMRSR